MESFEPYEQFCQVFPICVQVLSFAHTIAELPENPQAQETLTELSGTSQNNTCYRLEAMHKIFLFILAFIGGIFLAVQASLNARLGVILTKPIFASIAQAASSLVFATAIAAVSVRSLPGTMSMKQVPLYLWFTGGLFSVLGISLYYFTIPRLGLSSDDFFGTFRSIDFCSHCRILWLVRSARRAAIFGTIIRCDFYVIRNIFAQKLVEDMHNEIARLNIENLTSLWEHAASPFGGYFKGSDFSFSIVKDCDWPNRLWFSKDLTSENLIAAHESISTMCNRVVVPVWGLLPNDVAIILDRHVSQKFSQTGMSLKLPMENKRDFRLDFQRLRQGGQIHSWADTFFKAFNYRISETIIEVLLGNVEFYLAYYEGEPVGTAMLHRTGGIAGVHGVGIVPAARRNGFAAEFMVFLINRANALNASHMVLQASVMGQTLYEKIGFKEDYRIVNYVLDFK